MSDTLFDLGELDPRPKPWQGGLPAEREAGIASVIEHTPVDWAEAFDGEVARLAALGEPFTKYDVLRAVGPPDCHPSAIGARLRRAHQRGLIRPAGFAPRPEHGDFLTEWVGA